MNWGQSLLLPSLTNWTPFSGPWYMVVLMTAIGLVVGLFHRYTSARQMDVFDAVDKGNMDSKPVPPSLIVSIISLIGGFSLGPEVPTGMLAAALGSWVSKIRKLDDETSRTNVISGVSGAYSGLFSSPFVVLLMLLESSHFQTIAYYGTLLIAGLAAAIGFELFYALNGMAVSSLLGILSLPSYNLQLFDLITGILLGVVAVPVALVFVILNRGIQRLVAPLNSKPVIRSTLGGFLLGLLAVAIPTTIGLGTTQMSVVTQQAATIGIVLLLVFALAKIIALSGALNFGFIGGPIFPLLICRFMYRVSCSSDFPTNTTSFGIRLHDSCSTSSCRTNSSGFSSNRHNCCWCTIYRCSSPHLICISCLFHNPRTWWWQ